MTEKERNDYFYVCALIEYIARETKNHRGDIVNQIGEDGIKKLLYDAEVDHCLSFEQVSDEVVDYYKIKQGNFDTISACKYSIPSFLDIGKLYSIMIEDCAKPGDEVIVAPGVYREYVNPAFSGMPERRIIYRSAVKNGAVITGAEEVKNWERYKENVCCLLYTSRCV